MSIEVTGLEALRRNLKDLADKVGKETAKAINEGAQMVRTDAIKSIQNKSTGRKVVRYRNGKKRNRIAAAAGQAPNTDTGHLVKSIQVEVSPQAKGAYVGSNLDYAKDLELGTKNMKPRPWLEPAYEKNIKGIRKLISLAIRKEVSK